MTSDDECGSCGRPNPPAGCAINCGARMDDELAAREAYENSQARHPSRGGPLPARAERHARHLAEETNMPIEQARAALEAEGFTVDVTAAGFVWCLTHDAPGDHLKCSNQCQLHLTNASFCMSCRRPIDLPHRQTCALVLHVPAEGDVTASELLSAAETHVHPGRVLVVAPGGPVRPVDPYNAGAVKPIETGAEDDVCGLTEGAWRCTKGFGHVGKGDDIHYDHIRRETWRVTRSI